MLSWEQEPPAREEATREEECGWLRGTTWSLAPSSEKLHVTGTDRYQSHMATAEKGKVTW